MTISFRLMDSWAARQTATVQGTNTTYPTIQAAIDGLVPAGSTNCYEGLKLAYDMARGSYQANLLNRLILCSDGVANVGNTGSDSILA